MRKGSVTQLVSHWEGLQPPPASAARASASGSPSTQTHQPDVVALIISLKASSSAAIASLEAESAAQRAAAEATAHKRLEKLLRAAGRKSEKATKAHEEVALKHAALESAFAAREVTEVTTLQSARADHRVALEQLREKLGAQEDEAADLEETVARQRRSIETLTATLAERERELQRAAGRSAAAAAAADGGDAAVLSLEQRVAVDALAAELAHERAAVAQLQAQHRLAMQTSVEDLMARHAATLAEARVAHAAERAADVARAEERLGRAHRAAREEKEQAHAAAHSAKDARVAELNAQIDVHRRAAAAAKNGDLAVKKQRATHAAELSGLKSEHRLAVTKLKHTHGVDRQAERARTLARMQEHSLMITKQCDESLVAAAAQHRTLSEKLAALSSKGTEVDALRKRAESADALQQRVAEQDAALAALSEVHAQLAAQLAASETKASVAFESLQVSVSSFESLQLELAEAKAHVIATSDRAKAEEAGREAWMARIIGACAGDENFRETLGGNERISELEERAADWEERFMRMRECCADANLTLAPLGYVFCDNGELKQVGKMTPSKGRGR